MGTNSANLEYPRQAPVHAPPLNCSVVGQGPPLLFVHGLGGNHYVWGEMARLLRCDHTVIAIDLPGSGRSTPPQTRDGCADFEAIADDLASSVRELGQVPCIIIGHSMGGYLAALAVARHPAFFKGLVLVDQAIRPGLPAPPGWRERLEKNPMGFLEALLTPTVKSPEEKERILLDATQIDRSILTTYLAHMGRNDIEVQSLLSDFPILACARDAPPPGSAKFPEWLNRQGLEGIQNLQVERFPGASHWLFWDDPTRFADNIRSFEAWVEAGLH